MAPSLLTLYYHQVTDRFVVPFCRLLAEGDVFAVKASDSSGTTPLLHALLSGSTTGRHAARSYTFFKAVKILPQAQESLVVDSRRTAITLKVWLTNLKYCCVLLHHCRKRMTALFHQTFAVIQSIVLSSRPGGCLIAGQLFEQVTGGSCRIPRQCGRV